MSTTNTMQTTNTGRSTLIAAFQSKGDAESAVRDLQSAGINTEDVQTYAGSAAGTTGTTAAATTATGEAHEGGFMGWLKSVFGQDEQEQNYYHSTVKGGETMVAIEVAANKVETVADILNRHNPSNIHEEAPGYASMAGTQTGSNLQSAPQMAAGTAQTAVGTEAIPVIEEDLAVGKRAFLRGGVRVYSRVVEEPVEESVRLRDEKVYVDRKPVNRAVTPGDLKAGTEQVIEVQEFAEEAVVDKRARVVEEVRVGKNVSERTETVRDTVRHTEVDVEPITTDTRSTGTATGSKAYNTAEESDFRKHFTDTYGSTGDYSTYGPAYEYGYTSASDPRYSNRSFSEVESDLRADYGRQYPNSTWEKMKDSVKYGWDKVTGKTSR